MEIPITVIIPTKNEELAIQQCLGELKDFGQVVVVDSNSTDATVSIAQSCGAETVNFTWNGFYPKKHQWCLDNLEIRNEWILFLDADEYPSDALRDELRHFLTDVSLNTAAAEIPLAYHFMGKRLRHGHRVRKTTLLRKGHAHYPVIDDLGIPGMGEQEGHYQPAIDGQVVQLESVIEHNDPGDIGEWVTRHNRYSDWEAGVACHSDVAKVLSQYRSRQGKLFHRVSLKYLAFPFWSLIVKQGWRDGRGGVDYAVALAFYYWLIAAKRRSLRKVN